MTDRQQVIAFARMNRFTAKPMCGGVILHKAHGADFKNDFSKILDSWAEARAYLLDQIEAVKNGTTNIYPWDRAA